MNVGCIPSKALLNISHKYEDANKHFKDLGIVIEGGAKLDFGKAIVYMNLTHSPKVP